MRHTDLLYSHTISLHLIRHQYVRLSLYVTMPLTLVALRLPGHATYAISTSDRASVSQACVTLTLAVLDYYISYAINTSD